MSLANLKMVYERRTMVVPDFIDNTSEVDYYLYNFLRDILDNINGLILNQIVKDRSIKVVTTKCNNNMDAIFDILISNEKKYIIIGTYISEYIEDLINDLVLYEFYESATNIRNIKNGFVIDARQNL
jgi:pyruvate-formate lyase-activating enzyme